MKKNGGYAELFTSRRGCFNKFYFWSQEKNKDIVKREEITRKRSPGGFFMAKEVGDEEKTHQTINNAFVFEQKTVRLKTYDDISNIAHDDIVKYDGRIWSVSSLRRKKVKRQSQYGRETPYVYFIDLRM